MKTQEITVTKKNGEVVNATLLIPETVPEMVKVMSDRYVIDTMVKAYVAREKRRLISGAKPRERIVKIRTSKLTPEQKAALIQAGLLSENG